jgi:hypothetical protein
VGGEDVLAEIAKRGAAENRRRTDGRRTSKGTLVTINTEIPLRHPATLELTET